MVGEAHSLTPVANMHAPPQRKIVRWILTVWNSSDKTKIVLSIIIIITHLFKSCGLTVAVDGDSGHIHTFTASRKSSLVMQLKVAQQAMSKSHDQ